MVGELRHQVADPQRGEQHRLPLPQRPEDRGVLPLHLLLGSGLRGLAGGEDPLHAAGGGRHTKPHHGEDRLGSVRH